METNRFFLWLGRINAILFLLLLVAGLLLSGVALYESSNWSGRRAVALVDEPGKPAEQEHFSLSGITPVCGHDAKYVELQTERRSGGFSSGYRGGQTRNILFFVGSNREAHWLYQTNQYLIDRISLIPGSYSGCKDEVAAIIYYDVVKQDSNGDGKLSDEDAHTLAISDPYGRGYQELVNGATRVLDFEYDDSRQQINLLLQLGNAIVLRDYTLAGQLLAESQVTSLSGR